MTARQEPRLIGGLTWSSLALERCPVRLKRGKHFRGDLRAFQRVAAEAARTLGCAVRTVRDDFRRNQYLWIQFADHEIALGEPCPDCGSRELVRTHDQFGDCPGCGARLIFAGRVTTSGGRTNVAVEKLARKVRRLGLVRLEAFSDVALAADADFSDSQQEVWYGRARDANGEIVLLRVVYPLANGARVPYPEMPGEELYYLTYWPLEPVSRASQLGLLAE